MVLQLPVLRCLRFARQLVCAANSSMQFEWVLDLRPQTLWEDHGIDDLNFQQKPEHQIEEDHSAIVLGLSDGGLRRA